MRKLTTAMFLVSDVLARLVMVVAVLCAIAAPILGPLYARIHQQEPSTLLILGNALLWLLVAVGCYAITRRRSSGLALVVPLPLVAAISGQPVLGAVVFSSALLVFGLPFALVALQARRLSTEDPAA